jgi:nucleotide-binding universal stress UspA family protein
MAGMASFTSVLCAVDMSDMSARVVRHAAAFAAMGGGHLTVLTVTDGDRSQAEARLETLVSTALPQGVSSLGEPRLRVARVTQGGVADGILEFARDGVDLIVTGTHARSGLARWLLGSTSQAVLEQTQCPVLLLPPGQVDVVTLSSSEIRLHVGEVIAAVDLSEQNDRQLTMARDLAARAGRPLVLMTVARPDMTDEEAERALGERAQGLGQGVVHHLIVRRGAVAEQIAKVAGLETAGLMVMGLRERGRGLPGEIATQVLHGKDTVVLAVPPN